MEHTDLERYASANRRVFDAALPDYVALKVSQVTADLDQRRQVWLDASGCVWCLFDDERFKRAGDEAQKARERDADGFHLCVYWSFGDVVLPDGCDEHWVADRIVDEALRQLPALGLKGRRETRAVDGVDHEGVRITRSPLGRLLRLT